MFSQSLVVSGIVDRHRPRGIEAPRFCSSPKSPVFVGNINAPRQIVIAGATAAMDKVLEEALREGASKTVRLHVSVLSHCPLLQPVADKLQERISDMSLRTPAAIYIGNINARALRTKELVTHDLGNNISHGVRWHDATTVLKELGCSLFLEMPPGHVLSDLAQANLSDINSIPLERAYLPREGQQFCSEDISNSLCFRDLNMAAIRGWISRERG